MSTPDYDYSILNNNSTWEQLTKWQELNSCLKFLRFKVLKQTNQKRWRFPQGLEDNWMASNFLEDVLSRCFNLIYLFTKFTSFCSQLALWLDTLPSTFELPYCEKTFEICNRKSNVLLCYNSYSHFTCNPGLQRSFSHSVCNFQSTFFMNSNWLFFPGEDYTAQVFFFSVLKNKSLQSL